MQEFTITPAEWVDLYGDCVIEATRAERIAREVGDYDAARRAIRRQVTYLALHNVWKIVARRQR